MWGRQIDLSKTAIASPGWCSPNVSFRTPLMSVETADALPSRAATAPGFFGRCADGLVHDPPNRTRATSAFGAASETAIDLAGRPHGAFCRNGTDLMVRNDVARTHDHDRTPGSAAHPAFLFMRSLQSTSIRMMAYP